MNLATNHSRLWNDMPIEERKRLMPYQIQTHILHLEQMRGMIVATHRRQLVEIDDWIKNLRESLRREVEGAP